MRTLTKLIISNVLTAASFISTLPALAGTLEDGLNAHGAGNSIRAADLFRIAANEGDTRAYLNLGIFYEQGIGVTQSDVQAFYWYSKAAKVGDVNGQFNLAIMYRSGKGTTKSELMATKWYRKAAEQGHLDAQYNLGVNYYMGRGVPKSVPDAKIWLEKAAAQGDAGAGQALATIKREQAK